MLRQPSFAMRSRDPRPIWSSSRQACILCKFYNYFVTGRCGIELLLSPLVSFRYRRCVEASNITLQKEPEQCLPTAIPQLCNNRQEVGLSLFGLYDFICLVRKSIVVSNVDCWISAVVVLNLNWVFGVGGEDLARKIVDLN